MKSVLQSTIINIIPKKIIKTPDVTMGVNIYTHTQDVFEKQDSVKEIAVSFKKEIIDAFSDWDNYIPNDSEAGSTFLKRKLAQYTLFVNQLSSTSAESFSKLVFGEKQIEEFKNAAKHNSDVALFVESLEEVMGKSLEKIIQK